MNFEIKSAIKYRIGINFIKHNINITNIINSWSIKYKKKMKTKDKF